jgi:hypothetical protein
VKREKHILLLYTIARYLGGGTIGRAWQMTGVGLMVCQQIYVDISSRERYTSRLSELIGRLQEAKVREVDGQISPIINELSVERITNAPATHEHM